MSEINHNVALVTRFFSHPAINLLAPLVVLSGNEADDTERGEIDYTAQNLNESPGAHDDTSRLQRVVGYDNKEARDSSHASPTSV